MLLLIIMTAAQAGQAGGADPRIAAALKEISPDRIRTDITTLVGFGTRSTLSAQDAAAISSGRGIGAAREWIRAQFQQYSNDCGDCLEVKTDAFVQQPDRDLTQPTPITNVYAVLKGSDPESAKRIVLVTGHYDSRNSSGTDGTGDAPGANDDASGVAVSLECARVLSKLQFRATIIFLAVAGEEQGLYGSKHFAKMAREQGWTIEAVLNNDIVGGNRGPGQDPRVVRVFSEGDSDSPSRQLARYVADTHSTYKATAKAKPMLIFRRDRYLRSGDHTSFNAQGYAAVRFSEYREDFNHQHQDIRVEGGVEYGDLVRFVDFEYVARVARLNAATLASLAAAPASPGHVLMETGTLQNDTTLKWDPSPHANGYEVLWRLTSSADWEQVRSVGSATTITLPVSKDNVVLAVRALDAQRHRSLPVVPEPQLNDKR